ncbi:MAG: transporter substrate-binding domain-containing protein [Halieaceae bacterium]
MYKRLLALTLAAVLSGGVVAADKTVRLLANTSPPYADANLPEQGLALELVAHIFSRTEYQPEITIDSWSRAMEGVSIGLYDALAAAWYTEERGKEYLFSEPYLSSKLIVVKLRSDQADYFEMEHLRGKRLGVRVDYAYGIDFDAIPELSLVAENHLIQSLLNLLNGSVDAVIGDQRTMALQINEYLSKQGHKFQVTEIDLPPRERHVAATREVKGEDKMVAAFNRALAETLKDGSHAAIVKKWDDRYGLAE